MADLWEFVTVEQILWAVEKADTEFLDSAPYVIGRYAKKYLVDNGFMLEEDDPLTEVLHLEGAQFYNDEKGRGCCDGELDSYIKMLVAINELETARLKNDADKAAIHALKMVLHASFLASLSEKEYIKEHLKERTEKERRQDIASKGGKAKAKKSLKDMGRFKKEYDQTVERGRNPSDMTAAWSETYGRSQRTIQRWIDKIKIGDIC